MYAYTTRHVEPNFIFNEHTASITHFSVIAARAFNACLFACSTAQLLSRLLINYVLDLQQQEANINNPPSHPNIAFAESPPPISMCDNLTHTHHPHPAPCLPYTNHFGCNLLIQHGTDECACAGGEFSELCVCVCLCICVRAQPLGG